MDNKKISYIVMITIVFAGIYIFSTSCKKKNYQCVCTGSINGISADTTFKIKDIREKDAKQTCFEIKLSKFSEANCDLEVHE